MAGDVEKFSVQSVIGAFLINMSIVAWNFVTLSLGGENAVVIDSMLFAKVILDYLGYIFGQKSQAFPIRQTPFC